MKGKVGTPARASVARQKATGLANSTGKPMLEENASRLAA
jgi:hypothetical protein